MINVASSNVRRGGDLDEQEMLMNNAVINFVENSIIPFVADYKDLERNVRRVGTEGTGTLFEFNERYFIITAAHVISPIEIKKEFVGIPIKQNMGEVFVLGNCKFYYPSDEMIKDKIDIAVVELSAELSKHLKVNYRFLSYENIELNHISKHVYVSGFPKGYDILDIQSSRMIGVPFRFRSNLRNATQEEEGDCDQNIDLLVDYPEYYYLKGDESRKEKAEEELKGISGCPVWTWKDKLDDLWAPEKVLKVIGVQTAVHPGRWIKATNFQYVLAAFKNIDANIYEELRRRVFA
jgi:hypothetical protein